VTQDIPPHTSPPTKLLAGLLLLCAAGLAFQINLTRLFSVAQFYHFAFMIVSLAMLGFGASGTLLFMLPDLGKKQPHKTFGWLALAGGASILGSYQLANLLPFDSFSIAWDPRQAVILALHYLAYTSPFFFIGMASGMLLTCYPASARLTYAANLLGSAFGCGLALLAPSGLGAEGLVVFCAGMAALAAVVGRNPGGQENDTLSSSPLQRISKAGSQSVCISLLLLFVMVDLTSRLAGQPVFRFLELRISPYKSLSYALQVPGARLAWQEWNSFSRVDLVKSPGIRSLPGLSYRYQKLPPPQDGLLVDGDDLSAVVQPGSALEFSEYLPSALAFQLRPQANTLALEPRGGLDILAALHNGAQAVTAVEVNPLVVQAAAHVYQHPGAQWVVEESRSYLRRSQEHFDVIIFCLSSSYHPVSSGAYSLAEDYRYTQEAFHDALARLQPGGLLVITRWLQMPPSESLRAFALAVSALEQRGLSAAERIVAIRGYNTATLLVKNEPFTIPELAQVREFASSRSFDLVYAPGIQPEETNQFNILPEPVYYQAFTRLLTTKPRQAFYDDYPFDVRPPSDDHPFFGHYFKWSQARQALAEIGKTWQPFGGAGYFVILAILGLVLIFAFGLVMLPGYTILKKRPTDGSVSTRLPRQALPVLAYFAWIGFAYLLVEIPLIQRFILYLGQPAYALTAVLFSMLFFSGLGSRFLPMVIQGKPGENKLPLRWALGVLVLLLLLTPVSLPLLFKFTLGLAFPWRMALTVLALAPIGLLMGLPFPTGIDWLAHHYAPKPDTAGGSGQNDDQKLSAMIAWAWAVNGAASVIAAVLAALLALSWGYSSVFNLGALCYAAAWFTASKLR